VDNVGTVPAALTAYLAIQALKPDLVISLGTAGGFKAKGGEIGDVYISTEFANHDRHIPIPVSLPNPPPTDWTAAEGVGKG
jgi:5'-methylthioadenosine nucleosidase